jgi:hypothetical protein
MTSPVERRFRRQWLYAAAAVVALRLPHADGPSHDLSYQFAAAQNLLAGNGLALYEHWGADLSDPASLVTLSQFAAGYSLLAALLSAGGLGVGGVMKVLGATATLIGWWGWSWLAVRFFHETLVQSRPWRLLAFIAATVTPLLFTPPWSGTDIFLWAALPWVVGCVVRGADEAAPRAGRFDCLAGAFCGVAVLMRYASFFLIPYCAALMLWQAWRRPRLLARRWTLFATGLLPLLAIQLATSYVFSNAAPTPGGLSVTSAGFSPSRLLDAVSTLHMLNYAWAFWIPGRIQTILVPLAADGWEWQLALTAAFALLLIAVVKAYQAQGMPPHRDPRTLSFGLFVAVLAMLCAATVVGSFNYVSHVRYYGPLLPLSIFVAYSAASMARRDLWKPAGLFLRSTARLYAVGYAAVSLLYLILAMTPGRLGTIERTRIMAAQVSQWPSTAVVQELSPARQAVMQRLKEDPEALLLTSRTALFEWDPRIDRSRLHVMSCQNIAADRISGPARVIMLTFDKGADHELWAYKGDGISGWLVRAECYERLPDLKVVQEFPDEGLKLLESRVEPGRLVMLKSPGGP